LLGILIPRSAWHTGTGARYEKFGLRGASALAVAGVAAWVRVAEATIQECRIVLGAVHPVPLHAETASSSAVGHSLSSELSRAVGEIAAGECSPISDVRGSAEYRRELVRVLTVRALERAYREGCGHE
jgi:carbon-monoxide dehydrogenase medium subunit